MAKLNLAEFNASLKCSDFELWKIKKDLHVNKNQLKNYPKINNSQYYIWIFEWPN